MCNVTSVSLMHCSHCRRVSDQGLWEKSSRDVIGISAGSLPFPTMSSDLIDRILELFPDSGLKTHDVQRQHLALAIRLFRKRAIFDDFAAAFRSGAVHFHLHELLWFSIAQDLLAIGYVIPSRYALSPHKNAPTTSPDRNPVSRFFSVLSLHQLLADSSKKKTHWRTLPAYCLASRSHAMLKIASIEGLQKSPEVEVYQQLTSASYVHDPRNPIPKDTRLVPLRDAEGKVLLTLVVMPLLVPANTDRLHTHASAFECARQIINVRRLSSHEIVALTPLPYYRESLSSILWELLMGACNLLAHPTPEVVADICIVPPHRDIHISNLLMSLSGPPFKIYFIDFDLAQIDPERTCMVVWKGGKIQPPEVDEDFSQRKPYNPFLADIFALGVTWQHFQSVRDLLLEMRLRRLNAHGHHTDSTLSIHARTTILDDGG